MWHLQDVWMKPCEKLKRGPNQCHRCRSMRRSMGMKPPVSCSPTGSREKHFWNLRHVWKKPMGFFFCVPHGFPPNNAMFCGFPHVFPKTIPCFPMVFAMVSPFFHQANIFFRRPAEPRMRLVQRLCTSPETLLGADFVRVMMKTIGKP